MSHARGCDLCWSGQSRHCKWAQAERQKMVEFAKAQLKQPYTDKAYYQKIVDQEEHAGGLGWVILFVVAALLPLIFG